MQARCRDALAADPDEARAWTFLGVVMRKRDLTASLRAGLAANRPTYPLFDMARVTRALDDLLLSAWENRHSPVKR